MRSSFMTSSASRLPLLAWVGPPPSITHFESLPNETDLSGKLSGELTRRASARQLDVAPCHNRHVCPRTLLSKWHSSLSSQTLTQCHQGSRSQEPFPIFRLPQSTNCAGFLRATGVFHELIAETMQWLVFLNQIWALHLPVCLRFPVRHKRIRSEKIF